MGRITEKVIARSTDSITINFDEIPKHEMDSLCRVILSSARKAFKDPKFRADYEVWLAERKAGGIAR